MIDYQNDLHHQLPDIDATAMAEAVRHGKVTSYELVQAHLTRIEAFNPSLNAIVTLDGERALSKAKLADLARKRGHLWGELHGVPITVKDSFQTAGLKTTVGDKRFERFLPSEDAFAVAMLQGAGAIVIGKTNCAPLCMDVQTANPLFGKTVNPWNQERTSGGSSGGEGAAVAAGLSPLGLGSDTAGSIRIPASYCGVYGYKPTNGFVSRTGLIPPLPGRVDLDNHLTTPGPLARSVRDLDLWRRILSGAKTPEGTNEKERELRIASSTSLAGVPLDDRIGKTIKSALAALKKPGTIFVETTSPIDLAHALRTATELLYFEFYPYDKNDFLKKIFWKTLFSGGTFRYYTSLLEYRLRIADELDSFLSDFDCWLLPATPTVAPPHNPSQAAVSIRQNGKDIQAPYFPASLALTFPFNLTGHPVVVIPVALDDSNLPVAVQLVGRRGNDEELLRQAALLEKELPGLGKAWSSAEKT